MDKFKTMTKLLFSVLNKKVRSSNLQNKLNRITKELEKEYRSMLKLKLNNVNGGKKREENPNLSL